MLGTLTYPSSKRTSYLLYSDKTITYICLKQWKVFMYSLLYIQTCYKSKEAWDTYKVVMNIFSICG